MYVTVEYKLNGIAGTPNTKVFKGLWFKTNIFVPDFTEMAIYSQLFNIVNID